MKRLFFCLFIALASSSLHAQQIVTDTVHRLFKGEMDGDAIRAYFGEGNRYIHFRSTTKYSPSLSAFIPTSLVVTPPELLLEETIKEVKELNADSAFKKNRPRSYIIQASFDSAAAVLTVNRINRKNANEFEFRVLENKQKELLPWSPIKFFCETYAQIFDSTGKEEEEMAYLGEFKTSFGNNLTVDVRRKGTNQIVSSKTIVWVARQPELLGVFTNKEFPEFLRVFKRESQNMVAFPHDLPEDKKSDSLLVLKKAFAADEASLLFFLNNKVRSKELIEYKLEGPGGFADWRKNDLDENLIWLRDLPPGKYKLFIRYGFQRHNVTEYEFEIKPAWHQTTLFKIIAGSLTAAFFGFIFLLFKTRRQRQKLQKEETEKELAETGLKAVRSQLNPHFLFNSLSSIQGLVNKADLEGANHYLSDFSSLVRHALKSSDKEFVALSTEISIVENYLKLEQLRFGFRYSISVADGINASEVDVPTLLVQPLLENAVKHGVARLQNTGKIEVVIDRAENDLLVTVADNGAGFDYPTASDGYGLKLTEARIRLLNKTLKDQFIQLSGGKVSGAGMRVSLQFNNWF